MNILQAIVNREASERDKLAVKYAVMICVKVKLELNILPAYKERRRENKNEWSMSTKFKIKEQLKGQEVINNLKQGRRESAYVEMKRQQARCLL